MLLDLFFAGGALLMALSSVGTKSLFFAGRMLTGLGVGGGAAASAYLLEISPPALRGCLVELNELALGTGCVLAGVTSWLMGDEHWRWTVEVIVLIAAVQFLCIALLLHESPSWLATKGRMKEAREAAEALDLAPPAEMVEKLPAKVEMMSAPVLPGDRRSMLLALGCGIGHAVTATNTVLYYSRNILVLAGIERAVLCTVLIDAVKLFGILSCILTVELVGRRRLLIIGTSGIILGHVALAVSFAVGHNWIALVGLTFFIYCWNLSWSGLMLVVASELLPAHLRGVGLGAVYSSYWAISGVEEQTLAKTFRFLTLPGTFAFYGSLSFCTLLFVLLWLPETRHQPAAKLAQEESEEESQTTTTGSSTVNSEKGSCFAT